MKHMDYILPPDRIALYPPRERGTTKLLVLDRATNKLTDSHYWKLTEWLTPGTVLVRNVTKVLPARLQLTSERTQRQVEVLFLEKHRHFESRAIAKGSVKVGDRLTIGTHALTVRAKAEDGVLEVSGDLDPLELMTKFGQAPIPPYLKRASEASDKDRYQTVFASQAGSVAAPTASLNFTKTLETKLIQKGVIICDLVLHVGLGTFQPIRGKLTEHHMHQEFYRIPAHTIDAIQKAKSETRPVVALGTTVTRALEHSYKNWRQGEASQGEADLFIYPGYQFQVVDQLLTNFHAPDSTVLQLTAAMAGVEPLKNAYQHAIDHDYQFLSYGDSMLIR